jgi:hypothetical protein
MRLPLSGRGHPSVPVCALVLVAIASCGSVAEGATIYGASLTGAAERPIPVVTDAFGTVSISIDDAGTTLAVTLSFEDLTGPAVAAHIHCCADESGAAGVAIGMTGFPAVGTGTYSATYDLLSAATFSAGFVAASGGTVAGARMRLLSELAAGRGYFNIHTGQFPGGEIRGQFAVPEPALLTLMTAGALFAASRFRRP